MSADIDDVAKLAGVSTATVSRAMRGLPNVSEKTRLRVMAAAAELDYVSSPSASRLASGHTHTVGIVAPYVGRWFFGQVLAGAERVLREAGYDVLLFGLPDDAARDEFFTRMPLRRRVDAVLVLTLPLTETQLRQLRQLGVPLGAIGVRAPNICMVGIDDHASARAATNHLINLGHRRIAMIGGGASIATHFITPDDRRDGFRQAMAEANLPVPPGYELDGSYTADGGEAAMVQLLSLPNPPTAVFCQSDEMAMGAMRALRKCGLACPADVSIIGFDDHEMAPLVDLTTIHQPAERQGEIAAQQVLACLQGQPVDQELVPTRLVLRGTTCPPKSVAGVEGASNPTDPRDLAGHTPPRRPTTGD
jgi:DNA-binding LacI/PurR family transcriptional regulator